MPIWDDEELPAASQPQSISQRVRAGNALPILSHSALFDLALFGHESFKRFYAEKVGYPYPNLPDIGQLANYDRYTNRSSDGACKEFYLDCLKNHIFREARAAGVDEETLAEARGQYDRVGVTAFAHLLGYPRFDLPQTLPLQVLANLPFKTYLTISASAFLEDALRRAGKQPLTKMCRWRGPVDAPEKDLWLIPDDYRPSAERPLVYHLCGLDAHPQTGAALPGSLALSEDDHLEMLVNLAEGRGKDTADRLPALVRGALFDDVILLGFRLDSWAFRGLYYGLIRQTGQGRDRRGVCVVQLPPEERAKQEKYLHGYLDREARLDIFWGNLEEYTDTLKELRQP
ncbi:SIR2 family protein [Candidatus Amarolinea dominans]|uniref:SIR2 family protein n=1 Tax=Candidatus Amarolinea dominans TaxID=3140696 RepID=UPI003136F182|nr:SIR2 family protein [Anaerolineae bacterium]